MDEQATKYDGDLKVYTNDEEWVIAHDAVDARVVWEEECGGGSWEDEEWNECMPAKVFTLHTDEESSETKTFAEWAKRGRGYLASCNY